MIVRFRYALLEVAGGNCADGAAGRGAAARGDEGERAGGGAPAQAAAWPALTRQPPAHPDVGASLLQGMVTVRAHVKYEYSVSAARASWVGRLPVSRTRPQLRTGARVASLHNL